MAYQALVKSVCYKCGGSIEVGEMITHARNGKGYCHATECKPVAAALPDSDKANDAMRQMAAMLAPYLQDANITEIKTALGKMFQEFEDRVSKPLRIEVKTLDTVQEVQGTHPQFEELLSLIAAGDNVYLYGEPGSGKSFAGKQVGQALGREFGYLSLNPQSTESKLLGVRDAHGVLHSTEFRKRWELGGPFMLDEMDNTAPALMTTLNTGLENGVMCFPDGNIKKHADTVIIAAGNTNGRGATARYPERRAFDGAFMERFTFLEWKYDKAFELRLSKAQYDGAEPWVSWVQKLREYCAEAHPGLLVTPRASLRGARLLKLIKETSAPFQLRDVANMVVFKGYEADSVAGILKDCPMPTKTELALA